jgi:hypothetical protein
MWRVRQPKLAKSILTFPHISTAFVNPSLPAHSLKFLDFSHPHSNTNSVTQSAIDNQ